MTALEHAKRFVQKNAARTALVIVPLAMATSANASTIFYQDALPIASATPGGSANVSGAGSGTFVELPPGGVKFNGNYLFNVDTGTCHIGSGSCSSPASLSLTLFSGTGAASGLLDMLSIHAGYDYAFDLGGVNSPFSNFVSSITFYINPDLLAGAPVEGTGIGVGGNVPPGAGTADSSGPAFVITGWDLPPADPAVNLVTWSVVLKANFDVAGNSGIQGIALSVPDIEIGPVVTDGPDTTVPEPSTLLSLAAGVGLLVSQRRRLPRR